MATNQSMTIYDISKMAGVSIATVSRAMNSVTQDVVAPTTRNRIAALADKHGYTPSLAARALSGSALKTIGVLLPQSPGVFFHHYYQQIMAGVADELLETEYQFKLILAKPGERRWDRYNFKSGEAVDGLIVTHRHTFFSRVAVFDRLQLPCVVINDPEPGVKAYFVSGDHVMGGHLAARHLYAKGHRRVAVLTGPNDSSDSRLRLRGFRQFFHQAGRRVELTVLPGGEFQEERARQVAADFLKTKPSVTAFFCCNDEMALGVLRQLRAMRRSCPKDYSLIGYDDHPRTRTSDPPLTTIRVPLYEMAKTAARRLVEHLTAGQREQAFQGVTLLPVELVERQSVRRHR